MTTKKKTLIELMLDAGVKPEDIHGDFIVCDKVCYGDSCARPYTSKPLFSENSGEWGGDNSLPYICELPYFIKNWKSTIITKQQFVDAYNEKHKPEHVKQKTLDEEFCEPIAPLKVTVENNTHHTIHADLSDIDTEKFKPSSLNYMPVILTPTHYSIIGGKDLIARSAESYKVDEFRGAMRFNIEKYIDRLGKKDSLVKELRKIADYANRWADYEEKLQGSK